MTVTMDEYDQGSIRMVIEDNFMLDSNNDRCK